VASYNLEQLPGNVNISVFSGDDFQLIVDVYRDITNYTFAAKIEQGATDIDFTVAKTDIPNGTIKLSLTPIQTAAIVDGSKWALKWTDPDTKVLTILYGTVKKQSI
jgi:hypothetical protein